MDITRYGASVYFLFVYLESGAMRHAAISLACVATGLLVLAAEVLLLVRDDEMVREMRLNDPRLKAKAWWNTRPQRSPRR